MRRLFGGIAMLAVLFAAAFVLQDAVQASTTRRENVIKEVTDGVPCDHDGDALCTELPLVEIDTQGNHITKTEKSRVRVEVVDHTSSRNHPDDEPTFEAEALLNYRGNSSYLTFDKMSYRLTFMEEGSDTQKLDVDFLGMAPDSEWVLYGPFLDRSYLRNRLMYHLSREAMGWAPDTRFLELQVDGEYQGLYLAVEPIRATPNRLNLAPFGLLSGRTPYIVDREREGTQANQFETWGNLYGYTSLWMGVVYPSAQDLTPQQFAWIKDDITAFEEVLYSPDFSDPRTGYAEYIDVGSFVDYFLLNEFAMISDAGYLSAYTYKNIGGKLHMMVWDFNNGFDNYETYSVDVDEFVAVNNWYKRLMEDPAFVDACIARWHELRQGSMGDEAMLTYLDSEYASLGDAIERDNEVWGYTYKEDLLALDDDDQSRDPDNPEAAFDELKTIVIDRAHWMDEHLADLYDLDSAAMHR